MNYRVINTAIHQDEWYRSLDINDKLIWFYLLTAPESNLSGVYRIDLAYMSLNTGISLEYIKRSLDKMIKAGKMIYVKEHVIIINFLNHQQLNYNQVIRVLKIFNDEIPTQVKNAIKKSDIFKASLKGSDKYDIVIEWIERDVKPSAKASKTIPNHIDKGKRKAKAKETEKEKKKQAAKENKEQSAACLSESELFSHYDFLKTIEDFGVKRQTILELIQNHGVKKIFLAYQHLYARKADNWGGLFISVVNSKEPIPVDQEAKELSKYYNLEVK